MLPLQVIVLSVSSAGPWRRTSPAKLGEHFGGDWPFYFAGIVVAVSLILIAVNQNYFMTEEEFE
jgi:hypothetical protein